MGPLLKDTPNKGHHTYITSLQRTLSKTPKMDHTIVLIDLIPLKREHFLSTVDKSAGPKVFLLEVPLYIIVCVYFLV